MIVINLKTIIQRKEKLELELSNRLEFDKVLLDTIPNPIYYKNIEGKFLGCNTSFASLVNSTRDDIIGKTAFDFFSYKVASKNTIIDKELLETFGTSSSEFTFYTSSNEMKHIILNKAVYVHEMIDISETGYSYKKAQKDTELPENNLTEAA